MSFVSVLSNIRSMDGLLDHRTLTNARNVHTLYLWWGRELNALGTRHAEANLIQCYKNLKNLIKILTQTSSVVYKNKSLDTLQIDWVSKLGSTIALWPCWLSYLMSLSLGILFAKMRIICLTLKAKWKLADRVYLLPLVLSKQQKQTKKPQIAVAQIRWKLISCFCSRPRTFFLLQTGLLAFCSTMSGFRSSDHLIVQNGCWSSSITFTFQQVGRKEKERGAHHFFLVFFFYWAFIMCLAIVLKCRKEFLKSRVLRRQKVNI